MKSQKKSTQELKEKIKTLCLYLKTISQEFLDSRQQHREKYKKILSKQNQKSHQKKKESKSFLFHKNRFRQHFWQNFRRHFQQLFWWYLQHHFWQQLWQNLHQRFRRNFHSHFWKRLWLLFRHCLCDYFLRQNKSHQRKYRI